ncbi:MAG: DUF2459 domain-containing protein [Pseudomonadota bacterium]
MKALKWIAATILALIVLTLATLSSRDEALFLSVAEDELLAPYRVMVIDHGWHSGIVVRAADLRAASVALGRAEPGVAAKLRWLASRYPQAEWLEIGWGDRAVYTATPDLGSLDLWDGLRALFLPTSSVLQVVPGQGEPSYWFQASDRAMLQLDPSGFERLAIGLAEAVPDPLPTGAVAPALYGAGVFFPSRLDYHLFRTCNHWISDLLHRAGVPSSPVLGTLSISLMAELRWRL